MPAEVMVDQSYPILANETHRLKALRAYRILDTPPEAEFDHIVRLAAALFHVPTALVSFIDKDRQFLKSRVGFVAAETARDASFCTHTMLCDDVLVVPDTHMDDRFVDNPLVTGSPFVRFYAGAPLRTRAGHALGSICVIDTVPHPALSAHQIEMLQSLARIVMDLLERRRLDFLKRASLEMAAATPDAIVCSDGDGRISFWNPAAERMFGFSRSEAMGQPLEIIVPEEYRAAHAAGLARVVAGGEKHLAGKAVEIVGLRKDGTRFPIELTLAFWKNEERPQVGSVIRDVSERERTQERLRFLNHFDRLTGLPNRVRFLEAIDEALRSVGRFTVLKIGFDKFKTINGSRGMAVGDGVLKAAADRVVAAAEPGDIVARLGGDEFGLLRIGRDDPIEAGAITARVLAVLSEPFVVEGSACHLGASIGLVLCPGLADFDDADAVLKGALLALQRAKEKGGRRSEVFLRQLGRVADERHRAEDELRQASAGQQFVLYYQPQIRLSDGRITGAEALLRWVHPERGLLSPAHFLHFLETSAIATEVGSWITRTACGFAASLARSGTPIRIGVNLFAAQLQDPRLYERTVEALTATGLSPDALELEITETTVLGLDPRVIEPLRRLRDLGVKIAFDDYGTGFASLSLLKKYPLTRLKIDREFVRDIAADPDDAAIVKAVLALGASLGLEVIAEGIETAEQESILVAFGCEDAQGYRFGKPMPAEEFEILIGNEAATSKAA